MAQTYGDFELIISDDCSGDNTEEVCRSYASKDSRVRYCRNFDNLGMPGNLNACIRRAQGTYIANLHDGDIYRADLIAKWKQALDEVPSAAFVFNAYDATLADGTHRIHTLPFSLRVSGEEIAIHYFRTVSSYVWGTVMARSAAYSRAGLFDPSFGFISDVEMWLRLTVDAEAAYLSEPLITLGQRPEEHPFRYQLWKSAFWAFRIYLKCLHMYKEKLPTTVERYQKLYPQTVRTYFMRTMVSCLRHRRWPRVREGLGIWRDSDDLILRGIGYSLGRQSWSPDWYDASCWKGISPA